MEERLLRRAEEMKAHSGPQAVPTAELLHLITDDAKDLVQLEVELAKAEAKADLNAEIDLAKGAAVASVCAIMGLNMLIIAAVFALAPKFAWVAALIVGIVLLAVAALAASIGWSRAEKNPLGNIRESLKEDLAWARKQIK